MTLSFQCQTTKTAYFGDLQPGFPHLDPHETVLLGPLTDGFGFDDFVVAAAGVGFDPTNVFASPEIPFLKTLKIKEGKYEFIVIE